MNATMVKVATKSPLIFSVVAVAGVIGTAVCAVRDYKKAQKVLLDHVLDYSKKVEEAQKEGKEAELEPLWPEKKSEKIFVQAKLTWTKWIPTAAVGLSTVAAIVLAHRVSASQLAAVSAAAAFGGKKLSEQKSKLRRLIGAKNYDKLEDYITGAKVDKTEPQDGLDAFHDQYSGETVYARLEDVKQAFLDAEEIIAKNGRLTFEDYAKKLKLPMNVGFHAVGWTGKWVGFHTITRTSDKGTTYYSIEYPYDPTSDFVNTEESYTVEDAELLEDPIVDVVEA